ncbi:MAG: protein kinase, partial [Myxococcota bacterium]
MRVPLSQLDEPTRNSLAKAAELNAPCLQSVELSGGAESDDAEQVVEVFSPVPEGACLASVLQSRSQLSAKKVVRIGVDLAEALQGLHDSELISAHGAVSADHVWVTPKGHATLLRDPSVDVRTPTDDWSSSWITRSDHPAQHAAPELADSANRPTPSSDIYALGSLLFRVLIGRHAFEGETHEALFASHRETFPEEIVAATQQGASGDPLLRVLAFALAKDPPSRFPTAKQFAQALQRAGETLASSPSGSEVEAPAASRVSTDTPEAVRDEADAPPRLATQSPTSSAPPINVNPQSPSSEVVPSKLSRGPKERVSDSRNEKADRPKERESQSADLERQPRSESPSVSPPPAVVPTPQKKQPTKPIKPFETPPLPPVETSREVAAPVVVADGAKMPVVQAAPVVTEPPPSTNVPPKAAGEVKAEADAETDQEPTQRRRRRRKKKNRIPVLVGMMAAPLLMLGLAIALRGRGPTERPRPQPRLADLDRVPSVGEARREIVPSRPAKKEEPVSSGGYELVESDRLLWAPPYPADTPSPSLELLPPGPAALVTAKLSEFLGSNEAAPIRDA